MAQLGSYQHLYKNLRLERRDGILQVTLHQQGGPALWTYAEPGDLHDQLGEAFYKIGRDADNRVVILTGTGDSFLTQLGPAWPHGPTAQDWDRIRREGRDLLMNLLDIEAPVIGAANGPATIHAELLTLSDIVLAADTACFADKAHAAGGVVPGDGVHVWWPMLLGFNRARHFLLTGQEISAAEARTLGFVAEVLPPQRLLPRAWEIATDLAAKPALMLRYTRLAFTQHIKRRMLDDLGYGLVMESAAAQGGT